MNTQITFILTFHILERQKRGDPTKANSWEGLGGLLGQAVYNKGSVVPRRETLLEVEDGEGKAYTVLPTREGRTRGLEAVMRTQ